jgi:hypothetical protein
LETFADLGNVGCQSSSHENPQLTDCTCPERITATGTSDRLAADTVAAMLRRMPIPGPQENTEGDSLDDPQRDAFRLIGIALWRERRHTEKLLNGLLVATKAELGLVEQRMLAKLEDIDSSVSLVAEELARRSSDPPSGGAGS